MATKQGNTASSAAARLLRMGQLAEASGVSAATIKHYLREGLLPEPVKTSRNMAYYPPEFVERIRLIKQLQEERFMPLKVIREVLDADPERARAMVELEDRILERALAGERTRTSAAEVRERYDVPAEVLDRLEEIEVLSPNSRGYTPSDVRIIEAISRFRAGGYEEAIGFTVYDTLRYKRAMEELVREEVEVLMDRVAGKMDSDRAMELIEAGAEPLKDLIAAMHTKVLIAELERQRSSGRR
jgi:DNA-binding transcriptional MerR regulator